MTKRTFVDGIIPWTNMCLFSLKGKRKKCCGWILFNTESKIFDNGLTI